MTDNDNQKPDNGEKEEINAVQDEAYCALDDHTLT